MRGMPKASVLPLPVGDCASTSRPARTSGMTRPCTANADSIPRAPSASVSAGSTPRSANDCFFMRFLIDATLPMGSEPIGSVVSVTQPLDGLDVYGLGALLALLGLIRDLGAFCERAV